MSAIFDWLVYRSVGCRGDRRVSLRQRHRPPLTVTPRTTGPDTPRSQPSGRRIIPARAGNTGFAAAVTRSETDHPRSRGEHLKAEETAPLVDGSSPLARGTHGYVARVRRAACIIPARAGNTEAGLRRNRRPPDHPRSRGEHSGPRGLGWQRFRIIPARAANTWHCQ